MEIVEELFEKTTEEYKSMKWLKDKIDSCNDNALTIHYYMMLYNLVINLLKKNKQLETNKEVVFTKEDCEKLLKQVQEIDKCDTALTSNLLSKRIHLENEILKKKLDQLETNRDELKKWLKTTLENEKYSYLAQNSEDRCRCDVFKEVLSKIQELERGKNNE